ncbi:hypothetical protein LTR70_009686 [Exophiala xenobiotica]|uniref:Uncharacterized protein n=1 Tax=Lithohypha guttulata TaxID=1690604 RepID=A0ABR0JUU7_9EURO|nr:hypothetical protein LTR24_010146 [Lithohypha guttulata]KAK5310163.1 hypothetical protein LTR70_009686 [Exophiala xenobiotica]
MAELPGVALITGAGSGIGQAVALGFIRAGCTRMSLIDMSEAGLRTTHDQIAQISSEAQITLEVGNTTDNAFVERAVESLMTKHGRLDYAVNCAGIMGPYLTTIDDSIESLDHVMSVNYRGTLMCSRAEIRAMLKNEPSGPDDIPGQRGSIVHISSAYGLIAGARVASYCASKGAIIQLTKADAINYSPSGIRINCVCPGLVDTPATGLSKNDPENMKAFEPIIAAHPMKRWAQPREIADAVVFLCSGRSSFIQGIALAIDGGWLAT